MFIESLEPKLLLFRGLVIVSKPFCVMNLVCMAARGMSTNLVAKPELPSPMTSQRNGCPHFFGGGLGVFILAYWRLPPAPSAAPSTRPHGTPHHHAQHPLRGSQRPPPTAPPPPRPVPPPRLPAPAPTATHTTPPSTPATAPSTHPHGASHHTLHRAQHSPQHPPPRHPTPPRPAPPPRLPAPAPTAPHTTPAQHPLRGPQHPPPRHPTPPRPAPPPRPPAPAPPPYDTPHPPPRPAYPPGVVAIFPHRKNSGDFPFRGKYTLVICNDESDQYLPLAQGQLPWDLWQALCIRILPYPSPAVAFRSKVTCPVSTLWCWYWVSHSSV